MPAPPRLPPGAKCVELGHLADIFVSDVASDRATARHICRVHCPVLMSCLQMVRDVVGTEIEFRSCVIAGMDLTNGGTESRLTRVRPSCWLCRATPALTMPGQARLMVHGTAAAIKAHRKAKEALCVDCVNGQAYRDRMERRRRRQKESAKS